MSGGGDVSGQEKNDAMSVSTSSCSTKPLSLSDADRPQGNAGDAAKSDAQLSIGLLLPRIGGSGNGGGISSCGGCDGESTTSPWNGEA